MAEKKEFIRIRGARENNLKALNVDIPRNQFVVFTGLSGSGKSSLAFDTIYAEGQRRYMESLSSYARQFLGQMEKPNVDSIEGLPPAISIDQKSTNRNPRSTVGTVTEIYDYFRLLYARIGIPHCPKCGKVISRQSVDQMVDQIMALPERTKIQLLAPVVRGRKGRHEKVLEQAKRSGYVRVMIDGSQYELSEEITLDKNLKHNISIIVDRLVVKPDIEKRLTDSVETALEHGSPRIELDVQMTADGVAVVTHDTSLRRCTGCNANIYDLPYAQVQQLDAGRWFHRQFTGSYIPTLEEVLALCKGKAELNIEIKPSTFTPTLEAETVRLIHAYDYGADCVVTSQSYETLCKVKELDPDITTGYILALGVGTYYDLPAADFFSVESTFITSGMVQQIHLRGKTVSAWTVNRAEDARDLLSLGVDDVITDKPEMVQDLLNEDADLDRNLVLMRDRLKELLGLTESADSEVDPDDSAIEEVLEDPEELLDQA